MNPAVQRAALRASTEAKARVKRENAAYTPGPWRWEFNAEHRNVHLVGGRPIFDLTVMDFVRWGMGGAAPRFRDTTADGLNLLDRLSDKAEWIAPEPGREHHKSWHQLVTHPDARLMAAAPELLDALIGLLAVVNVRIDDPRTQQFDKARAAIAKATGETP